MDDVIVTLGRRPAARASDERLTENVSLNFAKVKIDYTAQTSRRRRRQAKMGWDIEANKKL